jgi:hypothetical protein
MKCFRWMSLLLLLVTIAPPASAQPDDRLVLVHGYVWVDDNLDGVRQSDEPLVSGREVGFFREPRVLHSTRSNAQGSFSIALPAGFHYTVQVRAGEPVEYRNGEPSEWSRFGCAQFRPLTPSGGGPLRLDLRARPTENEHFSWVPIAAPDSWPVADGQFFVVPAFASSPVCDNGFAVTNAEQIPFWDAVLARGLDEIGRPVTGRIQWDGRVRQAFERAVLEWDAYTTTVRVLSWEESGQTRGSTREEPFLPGPAPHFIGLPSFDPRPIAGEVGAPPTIRFFNPLGTPQPPDNEVVIQGFVWVDENLNGIYDPDEVLLRNKSFGVTENGRPVSLLTPSGYQLVHYTDGEGRYQIRVSESSSQLGVRTVWGEPVDFTVLGNPVGWAYLGCAAVTDLRAGGTYTLDVRVRPTYSPVNSRGQAQLSTAIARPDSWPVAGGRFFVSLPPGMNCDSGFPVTNEEGIPFWDTLLARGLDTLGKPVTGRFSWEGRVRQGFERAVLEWAPDSLTVRVLGWNESGMTRGTTREEPFAPGPSPHFLGLPSLDHGSEAPVTSPNPSAKVSTLAA